MAAIAASAAAGGAGETDFVKAVTWADWNTMSPEEQRSLVGKNCVHIYGDGSVSPFPGITSFQDEAAWDRNFDMILPRAVHGEKFHINSHMFYLLSGSQTSQPSMTRMMLTCGCGAVP